MTHAEIRKALADAETYSKEINPDDLHGSDDFDESVVNEYEYKRFYWVRDIRTLLAVIDAKDKELDALKAAVAELTAEDAKTAARRCGSLTLWNKLMTYAERVAGLEKTE